VKGLATEIVEELERLRAPWSVFLGDEDTFVMQWELVGECIERVKRVARRQRRRQIAALDRVVQAYSKPKRRASRRRKKKVGSK
jgi:hypothetical protein